MPKPMDVTKSKPKTKGRKRKRARRVQVESDDDDNEITEQFASEEYVSDMVVPIDDLPEYEVEEIIDKREKDGGIQYLVQWKGYSSEHNSWEPKEYLKCKELLEEFEKDWNIDLDEYKAKLLKEKEQKALEIKQTNSSTKFHPPLWDPGDILQLYYCILECY